MATRRLDWSFGPGHGPVSGVLNAAAAAVALTMVADLVDRYVTPVSPAWPVLAGAIAGIASLAVARFTYQPDMVMLFRVGCWLGAGLWSAWTLSGWFWSAGTPWSMPSIAMIGIGAFGASVIGLGLQKLEQRDEAKRIEEARARAEAMKQPVLPTRTLEERIAAEWTDRISRVCQGNPKVEIKNVEVWPGDPMPGFTLDGDGPLGGWSWQNLRPHEDDLASDARLPDGCSVKVSKGVHRGAFIIEVMQVNALAEDRTYPRDYSRQTINNPRRIAEQADTSPVEVNLRQEVVVLVGPTGSGKTTTMNQFIAEYLLCVDTINVGIDFNGGALAIPWLLAWRADPERCPRPAFSMVADTPEKALAITDAILRVIKDRKQAYAHVKVAANTSLLPISASIPLFQIYVDEAAEILGLAAIKDPIVSKVADNLLEIQRIGRDAGARLVISSLGATNETLGTRGVKVNAKVKIAMGGTPDDELFYLFDYNQLSADDAQWPGSAHIRIGHAPPFLVKFPHLLPEQIREIAIATSDRRCDPDPRALQVMGDVWTKHWEHNAELLAKLDMAVELLRSGKSLDDIMAAVAPERAEPLQAADMPSGTASAGDGESPASLSDAMSDLDAARQAMRAAEPVPPSGDDAPVVEQEPGDPDDPIVERLNRMLATPLAPEPQQAPPPGPQPARPKVDPRVRMRQLVWDSGAAGTGPTEVQKVLAEEGYPTTLPTVNAWMKRDKAEGILDQRGDRTPYTRGAKMRDPYEGLQ